MAKNLIVVNKALFDGFPSIVLPSLLGKSQELNPNETLLITASQSSWLCKYSWKVVMKKKIIHTKEKFKSTEK